MSDQTHSADFQHAQGSDQPADFEDAARALESRDELDGTFSLSDTTYPLRVLEPTMNELEAIEDDMEDDADEVDVIRVIADQYLVAPDVDVGQVGVSKLFALFEGMQRAWSDEDVLEEARAQMPVEGNPPASPR